METGLFFWAVLRIFGQSRSNPTHRGKRGVKRSLLTEAQGIPVGLAVDGANRHDMKLVRVTVDNLAMSPPTPSPEHPLGMCLGKGYDFPEVRRTLDAFGFTAHIRNRGEEPRAIKQEACFKARWVGGGRTHSWLNRFCRTLVWWDKSPSNYIAFLHFASALIAAGRLGETLSCRRTSGTSELRFHLCAEFVFQ